MFDRLLSIVAPHYCCGCGMVGELLCANCKYNIIDEVVATCIVCRHPVGHEQLCERCIVPYDKAWLVGERRGVLKRLIGLLKFERAKAAEKSLADLLCEVLPELPPETVVVPIPTAPSHIRERGYDHMRLIAKRVARTKNLRQQDLLYRVTNTKQRQATATKREDQARRAFATRGTIDSSRPYLLIDDVMTTGATLKYATKTLRDSGAKQIWIAVLARQI